MLVTLRTTILKIKHNRQFTNKHNIEVPSRHHCWRGKATSIKRKFKGRLVGLFQHCSRRLIVLLPPKWVPSFISRGAKHHTGARDLCWRRKELLTRNLASKSGIYENTRFLYMLQSWGMGQILSLPLRRKACWLLFGHPKNLTASAGFEPANAGTGGQHADH